MTPRECALLEVGRWLVSEGYRFVTITPESHRRVNRRASEATTIRDVFGWSRPFAAELLPRGVLRALRRAEAVIDGPLLRSTVRFSSLGDQLYAHSAYPTTAADAVFFGPDTYRFCAFLARAAPVAARVVDVGCGSGAGALSLADRVGQIVLADINPQALSFARVNATLAGVADRVEVVGGDLYAQIAGSFDLVVANPPYLVDDAHRVYRDGGGPHGIDLAVRIVREALPRLGAGGRVLLYTGAPIVDGVDLVKRALEPYRPSSYEELDPDVFGEELDQPAYASVERIAAVGACVLQP